MMATTKLPSPSFKPLVNKSFKVETMHVNAPAESKTIQLLHNPGISVEWSAEEQSILDDNLAKFANEPSLKKYIKIAALLSEKTVRDVALRCKWMSKKDGTKRRKIEEQQNAFKKPKDGKKDKADAKPAAKPGGPVYNTPPLPIDNDDGIPNEALGGQTGELFDQNLQVIVQIRANLVACKAQENTDLFVRFRDNLYTILNGMTNVPGIMSHMPQFPVSINTELADTILPKPSGLQRS